MNENSCCCSTQCIHSNASNEVPNATNLPRLSHHGCCCCCCVCTYYEVARRGQNFIFATNWISTLYNFLCFLCLLSGYAFESCVCVNHHAPISINESERNISRSYFCIIIPRPIFLCSSPWFHLDNFYFVLTTAPPFHLLPLLLIEQLMEKSRHFGDVFLSKCLLKVTHTHLKQIFHVIFTHISSNFSFSFLFFFSFLCPPM